MEIPKKSIIYPVKSRWNSFFDSLERLLELKSSITWLNDSLRKSTDSVIRRDGVNLEERMLSETDWITMEAIVEVLRPFNDATKILGGSKYTTLSIVYPVLAQLRRVHCPLIPSAHAEAIKAIIEPLVDAIQNSVIARWSPPSIGDMNELRFPNPQATMASQNLGHTAMFFDPRVKDLRYLEERERARTILFVKSRLQQVSGAPEETPSQPSHNKEPTSALAKFLSVIPEPVITNVKDELTRYREMPLLPVQDDAGNDTDPFEWWRQHRSLFPQLASLARHYLAIPATSVPSERLFSDAGMQDLILLLIIKWYCIETFYTVR